MKCIKHVGDGRVIRVNDDRAAGMTRGNSVWRYCPKWVWKLKVRDVK
jgi:hypothetical protein